MVTKTCSINYLKIGYQHHYVRHKPGRILPLLQDINKKKFNSIFIIRTDRAGSLCPRIHILYKELVLLEIQFFSKKMDFIIDPNIDFWYQYFIDIFFKDLQDRLNPPKKDYHTKNNFRSLKAFIKASRAELQCWINKYFDRTPFDSNSEIDFIPKGLIDL